MQLARDRLGQRADNVGILLHLDGGTVLTRHGLQILQRGALADGKHIDVVKGVAMLIQNVLHGLAQDQQLLGMGRCDPASEQVLIVLLTTHFIRADALHQALAEHV